MMAEKKTETKSILPVMSLGELTGIGPLHEISSEEAVHCKISIGACCDKK